MKRLIIAAALATTPLTALAAQDIAPGGTTNSAMTGSLSAEAKASLDTVLAADYRADDRARDAFRNPAETLAFFRVEPGMTVAEYAPGGGWYTRVLAPWLAPEGRYLAVNLDSSGRDAEARARAAAWPKSFATRTSEETAIPASSVTAFESGDIPQDLQNAVDRILVFRNIHSMMNAGVAESEFANLRQLLADDGLLGIVQHRAKADAPDAYADGSKGYVREEDVIALVQSQGFELVDSSEINANPEDSADWPDGVWTLSPSFALKEQDKAKYEAIGESDRMTLLFRKRG